MTPIHPMKAMLAEVSPLAIDQAAKIADHFATKNDRYLLVSLCVIVIVGLVAHGVYFLRWVKQLIVEQQKLTNEIKSVVQDNTVASIQMRNQMEQHGEQVTQLVSEMRNLANPGVARRGL